MSPATRAGARRAPQEAVLRRWAAFALALALAAAVAAGIGAMNVARLSTARFGELLGTSRAGEWADLSTYGVRLRLDDLAIAEEFPSQYAGGEPQRALPGMLLVRVRMTVEPTVDIAKDNFRDLISCDLALWTRHDARITPAGLMVEGPEANSCSALKRPIVAGQQTPIQQVFQVLPADAEGLRVQATSSDLRPQAGGTWPVWDFLPA